MRLNVMSGELNIHGQEQEVWNITGLLWLLACK